MAVILQGHISTSMVLSAKNGDINVELSSSGLSAFSYDDAIVAQDLSWAPTTGDQDLTGLATLGFSVVGADNPSSGSHHIRYLKVEYVSGTGTFTIETGGTNGVGADIGSIVVGSGDNVDKTAVWTGDILIDGTHKTLAITNATGLTVKITIVFYK